LEFRSARRQRLLSKLEIPHSEGFAHGVSVRKLSLPYEVFQALHDPDHESATALTQVLRSGAALSPNLARP
jgi:hypothetical protein